MAGLERMVMVTGFAERQARGAHSRVEEEVAHGWGVVAAVPGAGAPHSDQTDALVVAKGVCADPEMVGGGGDVPGGVVRGQLLVHGG